MKTGLALAVSFAAVVIAVLYASTALTSIRLGEALRGTRRVQVSIGARGVWTAPATVTDTAEMARIVDAACGSLSPGYMIIGSQELCRVDFDIDGGDHIAGTVDWPGRKWKLTYDGGQRDLAAGVSEELAAALRPWLDRARAAAVSSTAVPAPASVQLRQGPAPN